MSDALDGLDEREKEILREIAHQEGITIAEARARRDELAGFGAAALNQYAQRLREAADEEQTLVRALAATGVQVRGRWQAAYYTKMGQKQRKGQKEGHEVVHGTQQDKENRWEVYQRELEDTMSRNPHLGVTAARNYIAQKFGVSFTTIKRRTTNPQKTGSV